MGQAEKSRTYLEAEVAERAHHESAEEVRTTCSFARAERLIGREYHGRFLIELLQNAADAWRQDDRSSMRKCSKVAVLITDGPALIVANQGAPMGAEIIIQSLGHIGASTKSEGEAIGHKGIGFKSVLEITLTPEIYSGLQEQVPALAVKFDPELAYKTIRKASENWPVLISGIQGIDHEDDLAAVPVLRFPHWIDNVPSIVSELADKGFDTVVRLPFSQRFVERLNLDQDKWIKTVREALDDVSDQILLLLGCFSEVLVEDRIEGRTEVVTPMWTRDNCQNGGTHTKEDVSILRNNELSSRWAFFRKTLPELEHLAGEIAVGIRLNDASSKTVVRSAVDKENSAPFHLFFPTRIASGLPFLLHGYFEVDAGRTGFFRGSANRNSAILRELGVLTANAVRELAHSGEVDLVDMVNLIAKAGEPEDPLSRVFRADVLQHLDDIKWLPTQNKGIQMRIGCPSDLFVCSPHLTRLIGNVFTADYIKTRLDLCLPDVELSDASLAMIQSRQPNARDDQWKIIGQLCRPGKMQIWSDHDADQGFLKFLDLLTVLEAEDKSALNNLLEGLRGDPDSRLIPTISPNGGRKLLPVPDPSEGVPGNRSLLIMARAKAVHGAGLIPPKVLDLAFLPDSLLNSDVDFDRAKPLGIRRFTVDNILDRLSGVDKAETNPEELFRFIWQLLHRERVSGFGTKKVAERAQQFKAAEWFWCTPGRARHDENVRLNQQRERYLACVPVLCRDGTWRPAGKVGFGVDWAVWLEAGNSGRTNSTAVTERAAAYRALESISPGPQAILASPDDFMPYLNGISVTEPIPEDIETEETIDEKQCNAERHAFFLRLGVWEVPPIEAFESRDLKNRENFPWSGETADSQQKTIANKGGWVFGLDGWSGAKHNNVRLAEDFRFSWSLEEMAAKNPLALMKAMQFGSSFYGHRLNATFFCPKCQDSGSSHSAARYSSAVDGHPSSLALQLQNSSWVVCTLAGKTLDQPLKPKEVWWHSKPPMGAGLRQSAYRLLPLCSPFTGMSEELRQLTSVNTLDTAGVDSLKELLIKFRKRFEEGELRIDALSSSADRQAFVGLHRQIYERLAELAAVDVFGVGVALAEAGILCELGEKLVYQEPEMVYHDDGRYATYIRKFIGKVPFAILPRDRESVATRLGIRKLELTFHRKGNDEGSDVTDELHSIISDRIPELLSILVHHSLGTQTIEVTGPQFEERARRLQALTVRQLDDLVVEASVAGGDICVLIGQDSDQDLYLENPTSKSPVLFHDLRGERWEDRLRRKIASHLALILENQAYAATFALFLLAESDSEREEFLFELGISSVDVQAIATRIGIANEEERKWHLRWFGAIIELRSDTVQEINLESAELVSDLVRAGFSENLAQKLAESGGGESVRSDTSPTSPLRLLADAHVNLVLLDTQLRKRGDSGLSILSSRQLLGQWLSQQGRRCAAVLATRKSPELSKNIVREIRPPNNQLFIIAPILPDVLVSVTSILTDMGIDVDAKALADEAAPVLARAGGFSSVAALDAAVLALYDEDEQKRVLRQLAAKWRRELQLLAVLMRTGPAETRATMRGIDEIVCGMLPTNPSRPSELICAIGNLFANYEKLAEEFSDILSDSVVVGVPDRLELLNRLNRHGIDIGRFSLVERALEAPRRVQAKEIRKRTEQLTEKNIFPSPPTNLIALAKVPTVIQGGKKSVVTMKVGESLNRRNKELGDEGEKWALAAVVGTLLAVDLATRDVAVDQIIDLLSKFDGPPVEAARSHSGLIRSHDLDEEELIDELTGLLHVSRHSDAFGFDLIGWLSPTKGMPPQAMCLEVKSSGSEGFHLSNGEWSLAKRFHDAGEGHMYAVLVVRRSKHGGPPESLDLLIDPVGLVGSNHLRKIDDGYQISYQS